MKFMKEKTIKANKDQDFKRFLDQDLLPNYKNLCNKIKEPDFEKIQIFFEQYEKHENPIVELFLRHDDLVKHIFSVYEILDIRVSKQSFIDLKGFLKLCGDYSIIPILSNLPQITRIFMTYKKYETNIIDFSGFVILICCIAHIGFNKPVQKGFYEKIKRFFEFLERENSKIAEKLMLTKLLK